MSELLEEEMRNSSSSELLCLPFLDTDVTEKLALANDELKRRGWASWQIHLLRKVFAVGLWTQVFAWEEWHLGIWDVIFGYSIIGALLGFSIIVFGFAIFPQVLWVGGSVILASLLVILISAIGMRRARI